MRVMSATFLGTGCRSARVHDALELSVCRGHSRDP
jgi:hypothetical protein